MVANAIDDNANGIDAFTKISAINKNVHAIHPQLIINKFISIFPSILFKM